MLSRHGKDGGSRSGFFELMKRASDGAFAAYQAQGLYERGPRTRKIYADSMLALHRYAAEHEDLGREDTADDESPEKTRKAAIAVYRKCVLPGRGYFRNIITIQCPDDRPYP